MVILSINSQVIALGIGVGVQFLELVCLLTLCGRVLLLEDGLPGLGLRAAVLILSLLIILFETGHSMCLPGIWAIPATGHLADRCISARHCRIYRRGRAFG